MKRVSFIGWNAGYKEFAPLKTTISKLDRWNKTKFGKRKILDETVLEESAKYAHDNNLIYLVTILENEKPTNYIEVSPNMYSVRFYDELNREYMIYQFYGEENGFGRANYGDKLFLESVMIREFKGNTDEIIKVIDHIFKPDGTFKIIENDSIKKEQITSEAKNKIDVSANWETYPAFGNYENLIIIERGLDMKI
jgi:hypothetical protein